MMVIEAVLATGVGGLVGVVLGVLIMRLYERSLVYYLEQVGVPFVWLDMPRTIAFAAVARSCWPASSARWACSIRPGGRAGAMPTTSCAARAEPMLSCRGLSKTYVTERGEVIGGRRHRPRRRGRPLRRDHRPFGLGQVLADGDDRRPEPPVGRHGHRRRHRYLGPVGERAGRLPQRQDRLRLPVRQPAADPAADRQCRPAGPAGPTAAAGRRLCQGLGACWAAWACATISTPIRRRSPPANSAAP